MKQKWIKFVCRGKDYAPTKNSVICSFHFEEKYLIKGEKRIRLNYSLDPVPIIYPKDYIPQSSILPSSASKQQRKPPKDRRIPDEYNDFVQRDKIHKLDQLDESCAPFGFEFKRFDDHVVYFRIEFNKNFVPGVKELIVVDIKSFMLNYFMRARMFRYLNGLDKDIHASYQILACSKTSRHIL